MSDPDLKPLTAVLAEAPRLGLDLVATLDGLAAQLTCRACQATLDLRIDGALPPWRAVRRVDAFAYRHHPATEGHA